MLPSRFPSGDSDAPFVDLDAECDGVTCVLIRHEDDSASALVRVPRDRTTRMEMFAVTSFHGDHLQDTENRAAFPDLVADLRGFIDPERCCRETENKYYFGEESEERPQRQTGEFGGTRVVKLTTSKPLPPDTGVDQQATLPKIYSAIANYHLGELMQKLATFSDVRTEYLFAVDYDATEEDIAADATSKITKEARLQFYDQFLQLLKDDHDVFVTIPFFDASGYPDLREDFVFAFHYPEAPTAYPVLGTVHNDPHIEKTAVAASLFVLSNRKTRFQIGGADSGKPQTFCLFGDTDYLSPEHVQVQSTLEYRSLGFQWPGRELRNFQTERKEQLWRRVRQACLRVGLPFAKPFVSQELFAINFKAALLPKYATEIVVQDTEEMLSACEVQQNMYLGRQEARDKAEGSHSRPESTRTRCCESLFQCGPHEEEMVRRAMESLTPLQRAAVVHYVRGFGNGYVEEGEGESAMFATERWSLNDARRVIEFAIAVRV